MDIHRLVTITHWMPIVTFCPVNHLPDFIYVSVTHKNSFQELYSARKKIRKAISWKTEFMEELAEKVFDEFPDAIEVELRLMFGKHIVKIQREP